MHIRYIMSWSLVLVHKKGKIYPIKKNVYKLMFSYSNLVHPLSVRKNFKTRLLSAMSYLKSPSAGTVIWHIMEHTHISNANTSLSHKAPAA